VVDSHKEHGSYFSSQKYLRTRNITGQLIVTVQMKGTTDFKIKVFIVTIKQ